MTTDPELLEHILDQLAPLPVTTRPLFGGHALYLNGTIPAFVTDDTLSLKITELVDDRLTDDLKGELFPGSKPYWRIPRELLEDHDWLQGVVAETAARVPPPKPRKPRGTGRRGA
ncbi:TfoX/Sxy family protein [Rhodococcus sp. X156]|uniref:TfoX/Sxy family protein n=1 Tax=Rhodococcus sp. X156 TaxID=2499145 RepID=UPI0013E3351D|nr:TfoX/Sxy family protein [Rhodococcus sp. X156]